MKFQMWCGWKDYFKTNEMLKKQNVDKWTRSLYFYVSFFPCMSWREESECFFTLDSLIEESITWPWCKLLNVFYLCRHFNDICKNQIATDIWPWWLSDFRMMSEIHDWFVKMLFLKFVWILSLSATRLIIFYCLFS